MTIAARRPLVLDTNVLLLWLAVHVDLGLLRSFKRISAFTLDHVRELRDLEQIRSGFLTTPHVLAEASNFLDSAPTMRRADLVGVFEAFVNSATEHREPAANLVSTPTFRHLGLTDAAVNELSLHAVIATTDMKLASFIYARSGFVKPFVLPSVQAGFSLR